MTSHQENTGRVFETSAVESDMQLQTHVATIGEAGGDLEKLHGVPQALQAAQYQRQHPSGSMAVIATPAAQQHARWQGIPQELRERQQWCAAGADKAPLAASGQRASVTNPSTWCSFDIACQVAAQRGVGIGYLLAASDPYTCIDLDVKNATNEKDPAKWTPSSIIERHGFIMETFDSYTERSQSGQGLHIWVRAKIGAGARRDFVEVYSQERFIVCTGDAIRERPIREHQEKIDLLLSEIRLNRDTSIELEEHDEAIPDDDILSMLMSAANADKFNELCKGDWAGMGYPSQSEADLALMSMFTFKSVSNAQCIRLFRLSGLGKRDKATKDDVYLRRTLRIIRGRQSREIAAEEHGEALAGALLKNIPAPQDNPAQGFFFCDVQTVAKLGEASKDEHFDAKPTKAVSVEEMENRIAARRIVAFAARKPRDILKKSVPQPFGLDEAPPPIAQFAQAFSKATGIDRSGIIVAATTAAASIIDDRYQLEVNPGSNWIVSARQWAFLCAPPSGGKSPTIRPATDPIKRLHGEFYAQWKTVNEQLKEEDKSPMPAIYTSDATVPALTERLKDNPRGILMLNEEFSSWIGAIDSADRGEAAKNRGDWLQLRDGGPRQIDRISRGSVYVPNWGASVLAACTPDGIAKQMKNMPEDGLIQRFVPCIMGTPDIDADGDCNAEIQHWEQVIRWAYQFTSSSCHRVRFNSEAREMFEYERKEQRKLTMATEEMAPSYAAHLGKHPGMLAEVALTFHVFSGHQPGPEIDAQTMKIAILYMRRVRKHAYYLYSGILNTSPAFELAQALARSIVAADEPITTVGRDWMTQHCQAFKKADDRLRREAVQLLEDADWLEAGSGSYRGWPSKYAVHERVCQMFAREGEQWRERRAAVREAIGGGD